MLHAVIHCDRSADITEELMDWLWEGSIPRYSVVDDVTARCLGCLVVLRALVTAMAACCLAEDTSCGELLDSEPTPTESNQAEFGASLLLQKLDTTFDPLMEKCPVLWRGDLCPPLIPLLAFKSLAIIEFGAWPTIESRKTFV